MSRHTLPLWSWGLTAALSTAILALLVLDPFSEGSHTDLNLERLRDGKDKAPLIVLIGSSKLRCAVGFDDELASALKARGVKARVVRIAYPNADYQSLRPAFAALEGADPSVVLVEAELLLQTRSRMNAPDTLPWRQKARQTARRWLGHGQEHFNDGPDASAVCGPSPPRPLTPNDLADYRVFLNGLSTSTAEDRAPYLEALSRLRAHGARVGLIELTRSPAAADVFPEPLGVSARRALAAAPGPVVMAPPQPFAQSAYVDFGHMNDEGRQRYTAWLIPQLASLVEPAHD
jgi:hypothetical protein